MRAVIGVILGFVVSVAVVTGVRFGALMLHPLPGMAVSDPVAMGAWLDGAPLLASGLYVAALFIGALVGAWLAMLVARWAVAAWIVAGLDLLLSAANLLQLSYPLWMQVVLIAGPLLGGWLAIRLAPVRADDPIDG